jgi:hypothetical protein
VKGDGFNNRYFTRRFVKPPLPDEKIPFKSDAYKNAKHSQCGYRYVRSGITHRAGVDAIKKPRRFSGAVFLYELLVMQTLHHIISR